MNNKLKRLLATLLLAIPTTTGTVAATPLEPPLLEDIDPLAQPAPHLERPLTIPSDERAASDKILSALRTKTAHLDAVERLRVIITLHDPNLHASSTGEGLDEIRELENIAALEHQFVDKAQPLGFDADRALAHFPIVIGEIDAGQLGQLAALPEVRAIEEERQKRLQRDQGRPLMDADRLRTNFGGTGSGVGIAVIDTGIDWTHPELDEGQVVAQLNTTGDGGIGFDVQGHGTSVAGITSGEVGGVAPQSRVWAFRVFRETGSSQDAWILAALDSIFHNRDEFGGIHVVNMSLGGGGPFNSHCDGGSPAYTSIFQQLVDAGIVVFVASGNEAFHNGVASPACHSQVIAVGAVYDGAVGSANFVNCSDPQTAADQVTCYSNSGDVLDILAPSHCAVTPTLGGGYASCFGGTSAASPYAAGVAAQILSLRPSTSPAQMQTALMTTGRPIVDPRNGLQRNRVNAVAAYESLSDPPSTCTPANGVVCLQNGRFRLETTYVRGGVTEHYVLDKLNDEVVLGFYDHDPTNLVTMKKVKDNCGPASVFTFWWGGITLYETTVDLTDTQTGTRRVYTSPAGGVPESIRDATWSCN